MEFRNLQPWPVDGYKKKAVQFSQGALEYMSWANFKYSGRGRADSGWGDC